MDTTTALYDILQQFSIVLRSFQGVKPWKLQSNLTFEPLGGFQSVLPLFGVPRKMLHNEHHPSPLRHMYYNFRSFYGHFKAYCLSSVMSSSPGLGNDVLAIIGPKLCPQAQELNLRTLSVLSLIPRLGN